jgi:pre-mRNA-splicing helicase BRR2
VIQPEDVLYFEKEIMSVLNTENARECEKKLIGILSMSKFDLIRILVKNRFGIYFKTKLEQAQTK